MEVIFWQAGLEGFEQGGVAGLEGAAEGVAEELAREEDSYWIRGKSKGKKKGNAISIVREAYSPPGNTLGP